VKLSELKPCANCAGAIAPTFYLVEFSQAIISGQAAREVLGVASILGGLHALPVAEAMAPRPDDAVLVFGDKDASLKTRLLICQECFLSGPLDLARLWEASIAHQKSAAEAPSR
jgi:hypothetical protein